MMVPLIPMPKVWHVGVLDPAMRGTQHAPSYEGAGLSVSNCPGAWREMASLNGPTLSLERAGSAWIDLAALPSEAHEAATEHARAAGLAEDREVWRAWLWEEGRNAWHSRLFESEAEGRDFTIRYSDTEEWPRPTTLSGHLSALPSEAWPLPSPELGERVTMPLLTEAGDMRSKGFGRMVDASDMLVAMWAEDVLRPIHPDVVGIWWRERLVPAMDLAPRGAAFAGAVAEFVPTSLGHVDPPPFAEPDTVWTWIDCRTERFRPTP